MSGCQGTSPSLMQPFAWNFGVSLPLQAIRSFRVREGMNVAKKPYAFLLSTASMGASSFQKSEGQGWDTCRMLYVSDNRKDVLGNATAYGFPYQENFPAIFFFTTRHFVARPRQR